MDAPQRVITTGMSECWADLPLCMLGRTLHTTMASYKCQDFIYLYTLSVYVHVY